MKIVLIGANGKIGELVQTAMAGRRSVQETARKGRDAGRVDRHLREGERW